MLAHHNIQPIYNHNSKILILGSFPLLNQGKHSFFIIIHKIAFGRFVPYYIIMNLY